MSDEPDTADELDEWQDPEEEPGSMGLLDHLEDLRFALLKSLGGFVLGVIITAFFFMPFFNALKYPLERAIGGESPDLVALTTTSVMGVFMVIVQVCLIGGIGLGLPFMLYYFARFVAPGLTDKEKGILLPACIATLVLFVMGCLFSYFVVLPAGFSVSLYFNMVLGLDIIWTAQSYYSLVIWMMISVGLAFEFPLIVVILQYIGIVTPQQLRTYRRHMVIVIMVAAALITPGQEFISMIMLALVLYFFYEAAIYVGAKLVKKREAELEAELDEDE